MTAVDMGCVNSDAIEIIVNLGTNTCDFASTVISGIIGIISVIKPNNVVSLIKDLLSILYQVGKTVIVSFKKMYFYVKVRRKLHDIKFELGKIGPPMLRNNYLRDFAQNLIERLYGPSNNIRTINDLENFIGHGFEDGCGRNARELLDDCNIIIKDAALKNAYEDVYQKIRTALCSEPTMDVGKNKIEIFKRDIRTPLSTLSDLIYSYYIEIEHAESKYSMQI